VLRGGRIAVVVEMVDQLDIDELVVMSRRKGESDDPPVTMGRCRLDKAGRIETARTVALAAAPAALVVVAVAVAAVRLARGRHCRGVRKRRADSEVGTTLLLLRGSVSRGMQRGNYEMN
jgi:hypothetical protein